MNININYEDFETLEEQFETIGQYEPVDVVMEHLDRIDSSLLGLSNIRTILEETKNRIVMKNNCSCNCGGFALGVFEWVEFDFDGVDYQIMYFTTAEEYNPSFDYNYYNEDGEEVLVTKEIFEDLRKEAMEQNNECAQSCVEHLLNEYDVRLIEDVSELEENEYAFVFRTSVDDFHFIRRFKDGTWAHKPGGMCLKEIDEADVFADEWEHGVFPYCSNIYMFAAKY